VEIADLLIVDDDSDVSEILAEALREEDYMVRRAGTVRTASTKSVCTFPTSCS
jgi:DNA-binding response OmpR family regulator